MGHPKDSHLQGKSERRTEQKGRLIWKYFADRFHAVIWTFSNKMMDWKGFINRSTIRLVCKLKLVIIGRKERTQTTKHGIFSEFEHRTGDGSGAISP